MAVATHDAEASVPHHIKSKYRNEAARQLLREWREDTSGYDEKTWARAKELIESNRLSIRHKFHD